MDTPIQLIVGLGNPGSRYEGTRHNAGADFVLALARCHNISLKQEAKFFGKTGRGTIDNRDIRLLIPSTYMNRSGQAVSAAARFYNIPPEAILVVHDELDLNPGTARLKLGGGHGGHNGLRDTIKALGNNKGFARLRIGIGHPGHADDVVDFVLKKASKNEQLLIDESIHEAIRIIPDTLKGQWNDAMKKLHTASA
ncbi:MAG: aminoacyl-tRNA hydrolase [Porticoccaceae bacterium]|nr:aminoacyl-tRNA hydrolase [Pseudomonadales bacterium]MCP5303193.1 aminoacyl-tRNA hydrolase [Pseudomonadales bacterium]